MGEFAFCYWSPCINVCKIIPPEYTKTHHFDIKNQTIFWYTPSPYPTPWRQGRLQLDAESVSSPLKLNPVHDECERIYSVV